MLCTQQRRTQRMSPLPKHPSAFVFEDIERRIEVRETQTTS